MRIQIENYKNIEKLDLTIENKRINFFYGICGSGKSSLVKALTKDCEQNDISIGKNKEDVIINVDGSIPSMNLYRIFNEETVTDVIFKDSEDGNYYNIFVGNESEITKLENKFNESISLLLKKLDMLINYKENINKLFSTFGKPGVKGKLTQKAKVNLLSKQISGTEQLHKEIVRKKGLDYVNWKIQGMSIDDNFSKHICPFCYHTIEDNLFKEIEKFKTMAPRDFEVIFKGSEILKELNIKEPDYYENESLETFKVEIEKCKIVQQEIEKIINFCNFPKDQLFSETQLNKLEIPEFVFEIFPDLEEIIREINRNIDELINLNQEMRKKAKYLVKGNEKKLNNILSNLGIPYSFKPIIIRENKTASIVLYHVKDKDRNNMKLNLSYGERNIVSLIIFLFGSDKETLIIDDPASSYDDYRRKEIFDLLLKYTAERTVLVLSHDQVFLKYALLYKKQHKDSNKIGRVCSFENYEGIVVTKDIEFKHFSNIDNFIIEQIKKTDDYYRKILNARLLLEINKRDNGNEYGYLSAILHCRSKSEINSWLKEKNIEEIDILNSIKNKFGIDLPKIKENYLNEFKFSELTMFEKAILYREIERKRAGKTELYQQLSDMVHLNEALIVGLNPYKYNYFSPNIYNAIKEYVPSVAV